MKSQRTLLASLPAAAADRVDPSGRCSEKGCAWPAAEYGLCVHHLRDVLYPTGRPLMHAVQEATVVYNFRFGSPFWRSF